MDLDSDKPVKVQENQPLNPGTKELLRSPEFLKFWCIGVCTGTMRWLEILAVGIYTLEVSGSALIVAFMFVARMAPSVFLGALTGALATRVSRKKLLAFGMAIASLTSIVLFTLSVTQNITLWAIAIGSVINGVVWTLEHPVRRTVLSDVAGHKRIRQAMSLDSFSVNSTRMFGPLAGGAVYGFLGLPGVFLISASVFAFAAALALWARVPSVAQSVEREGVLTSLVAGLRYIQSESMLRAVMLVTIIANFFGFSYASMVPVIGRNTLGLTAGEIGLLQSMEGVGATLSALFFATTSMALTRFARTFAIGALGFMICLFVFAQSQVYLLSVVALFAAGVGLGTFSAMQSTALLNRSDPAQRTRVMGVLVMCIGAGPLGVLTIGALADWLGPTIALSVMAVLGLVCTGACFWRYPALSE